MMLAQLDFGVRRQSSPHPCIQRPVMGHNTVHSKGACSPRHDNNDAIRITITGASNSSILDVHIIRAHDELNLVSSLSRELSMM
eukprot:scaffold20318_cov55-Attheya_sp.AAC.1